MFKFLLFFPLALTGLFLDIFSLQEYSFSSGIQNTEKPLLIYVNDPLCSWCYGFAPEISRMKEKYANVADFRMVEGGLRPGTNHPMNDEMRDFLKTHWEEIHIQTGQPFSYEILKSDFIYDTEPPCRAVVTMRQLKPEAEFAFFILVQKAFYSQNKSTNDPATYEALADSVGVNGEEFKKLFASDEMKQKTQKDFELSENLGIYGFPAVLIKKGEKIHVITKGYDKFAKLEKKMDKLLLPR